MDISGPSPGHLDEFGADEMTIEVWIDGDGLPVRHDMVMELGTEGEMAELAGCGVVGFKAFLCDSGLPEFPRADDLTLLTASPSA